MAEGRKYGIVTGASRGLGAACAKELAREGYDVIITYSSKQEQAKEIKTAYEKEFNVRVETYKLQVEKVEEWGVFKEWVIKNFGENLQVLINNAGIIALAPGAELPPETFSRVMDVDVDGTYFGCNTFVPMMIKNHFGKIINMCSAVGLRATPTSAAYAASKFAVRGLTQALALDLGQYNIQVNAIAPGSHKTDMYYETRKKDPEAMDLRTKLCPLQRAGEVEEMEFLVRYFLASNFITGQVVSPNGGTTMV